MTSLSPEEANPTIRSDCNADGLLDHCAGLARCNTSTRQGRFDETGRESANCSVRDE